MSSKSSRLFGLFQKKVGKKQPRDDVVKFDHRITFNQMGYGLAIFEDLGLLVVGTYSANLCFWTFKKVFSKEEGGEVRKVEKGKENDCIALGRSPIFRVRRIKGTHFVICLEWNSPYSAHVVDVFRREVVMRLTGATDDLREVSMVGEQFVVTVCNDRKLRFYHWGKQKLSIPSSNPLVSPIMTIALAGPGYGVAYDQVKWIYACGDFKNIQVFRLDFPNEKAIRDIKLTTEIVTHSAKARTIEIVNNNIIAVGNERSVSIINSFSKRVLRTLNVLTRACYGLLSCKFGERDILLQGSDSREMCVYDVTNDKVLQKLKGDTVSSEVHAIAICELGWVVTAGCDFGIMIYRSDLRPRTSIFSDDFLERFSTLLLSDKSMKLNDLLIFTSV